MPHIRDCMYTALVGFGYGDQHVEDMLIQYYQDNGAVADDIMGAEFEFLLAQGVVLASLPDMWNEFLRNPVRADLIAFMTTVFPVSVYFAWQESSVRQASWGKSKRGLIVESKQGQRVSFFLALGRSLCKLLPWQIAHTSLFNIPGWPTNPSAPPSWVMVGLSLVWIIVGVYALSILISKEKLALYDRLLGIRVVSS